MGSFQMTVEMNLTIAIATLGNLLTNLASVF